MRTKQFTTSLAVFFLVLFASTKVLGFHEFLHNHEDHHHHNYFGLLGIECTHDHSHDHDHQQNQDEDQEEQKEDCDLCDKILLDYLSAYSGATQVDSSDETPQQFYEYSIQEYTSEIYTTELIAVLFSRPPPTA